MTDRDIMQQALRALENNTGEYRVEGAKKILRDRLYQPEQEHVLQEIEQYRMQMAGISTAAIGYWKEGDDIHPEYDTIALRDVAKLYAKYDALYKEQPEQEPSGWKLVPLKPTQEMLRSIEAGPVSYLAFCWKAMLSAAPTPPQRKPLTDEQYFEIGQRHGLSSFKVEQIHKEIEEAAHGIKGGHDD